MLGIDQWDTKFYSDFCEAAMLNKIHNPWFMSRKKGIEYCVIEITSCQCKDWWYNDFIGAQCMAIKRNQYSGTEYELIRLNNSKIHTGRTVSGKDAILI